MPPRPLGQIPFSDTIKSSDIDGAITGIAARVRRSANVSASGAVSFDQEEIDTNGMVSLGTDATKINLNVAGLWVVGYNVLTDDHGGSYDQANISVNGTTQILGIGMSEASGQGIYLTGVTLWRTTLTTDYIQMIETDPGHHLRAAGSKSIVMWAALFPGASA